MTQETYKGLCIGGPKAGEMLEARCNVIYAPRMISMSFRAVPFSVYDESDYSYEDNEKKIVSYRFLDDVWNIPDGTLVSFWIHCSLEDSRDVTKALMDYYMAGKHPQEDT